VSLTTIYQRTPAGRDEIHHKQAGLTQSERQVLIMIDGVMPYQGVRSKLSALSDERFERAVRALLKKELIGEVFLPIAGQEAEQIETFIVDRFLQQEPTDPVTIISYDPEEDFGDLSSDSLDASPMHIPELDVIVAPEPAVDETHARMVDSLQEELRMRQAERREQSSQSVIVPMPERAGVSQGAKSLPQPPGLGAHWGYWMIGLGVFLILAFIVIQFFAR
jgi:hypothetical protein